MKKSTQLDLQITQALELNLKIPMIRILKELVKNINNMCKQMENFSREMGIIKKVSQMEVTDNNTF